MLRHQSGRREGISLNRVPSSDYMARASWNESTLQFTLELNGVGKFDEQVEPATKTRPVRSTAIALTPSTSGIAMFHQLTQSAGCVRCYCGPVRL